MRFFALALAAAFAAVASSIVIPHSSRQVDALDAIGLFEIRVFLGLDCPRKIEHTATVNTDDNPLTIPHSAITQNGNDCNGGSMTVYTDANAALAAVTSDESKSIIQDFMKSGEPAIYGVETEGRKCGGSSLGKDSVIILFTPAETFVLTSRDVYPAGKRYMIVEDPTVPGVCEYSTKLRSAADTVPTPEPSVEPTAAPKPPVGGGGGGVGVGGGGNGSGSGTAEPTPDSTDDGSGGGSGGSGGAGGGVIPGSGTGTGTGNGTGTGTGPNGETTTEPSISPEGSVEGEGDDGDDDDDGSVCFPADAIVEVEGGSSKKISDVQIGDRVKVADGVYSDVFMFTHKDSKTVHDFVTLSTSAGAKISATRGHYLYINGNFAAAASAKAGDILELGNGARTTVQRVSIEKKVGLYNPQTVHGDIIVNSIRASTFTRTVEPQTAQALLAPLRMMYDFVGLSASFLDNGADGIAALLPKGQMSL